MANKSKNQGIRSWPEDDRPREKLLKRGAKSLSNSELLAILLRTGTNGVSAVDLARNILKKFGTFRDMAHTDTRDWKEFKGLGGAKIAHIQAALEIGRRYQQDVASTGKQKIASAKDIQSLPELFRKELSKALFYEEFSAGEIQKIMKKIDTIIIAKACNRSVLGSMNQMLFEYEHTVYRHQYFEDRELIEANRDLNRSLRSAIGEGRNDYGVPIEQFKKKLVLP